MPVVDFVIATHNRSALLARTLSSFGALHLPHGWRFRVTVVANACTDDTMTVAGHAVVDSPFTLRCLEEPVPGKSSALNTGVAACDGDWIAFIDDDERISPDWLDVFVAAQARHGFDFAGGRYLADFEQAPPEWLPLRHLAPVLAVHADDVPETRVVEGESLVWGGNFIVRREALLATGPFDVQFARQSSLMALGCEDADMVRRLLSRGYVGWFLPAMQIQHWVPSARLTRAYFRDKIFGHGYNARRYERAQPTPADPAPRILGLPRWQWRVALRSIVAIGIATLRGATPERFSHELDLWWVAGYLRAVRDGQ